jgi:hypothetical protein
MIEGIVIIRRTCHGQVECRWSHDHSRTSSRSLSFDALAQDVFDLLAGMVPYDKFDHVPQWAQSRYGLQAGFFTHRVELA